MAQQAMRGSRGHSYDDRKVVRQVVEYRNTARVSAVRGVRRGLAWATTRVVREIATNCGIDPQRLVRRRIKTYVTRGTVISSAMNILVRDIPAIKLKGVTDTGVSVGMVRTGTGVRVPGKTFGRSYRDAFIARGRGGNWQVFRRTGKVRPAIEAIKVSIRAQAKESIIKWMRASIPIAQAEVLRQLRRSGGSASEVAGLNPQVDDVA